MTPEPDLARTENLLESGARLLDESKRLLFDLDRMAHGESDQVDA